MGNNEGKTFILTRAFNVFIGIESKTSKDTHVLKCEINDILMKDGEILCTFEDETPKMNITYDKIYLYPYSYLPEDYLIKIEIIIPNIMEGVRIGNNKNNNDNDNKDNKNEDDKNVNDKTDIFETDSDKIDSDSTKDVKNGDDNGGDDKYKFNEKLIVGTTVTGIAALIILILFCI